MLLAKWANNQIKQELYYKSSTSNKSSEPVNKKSTTVAVPAPVAGKATTGISLIRSVGTVGLGILVSISGSSSEKQREEQHTYYRALEKKMLIRWLLVKELLQGT